MNWRGWVKQILNPTAYDQGHQDGFAEGYEEGQQWGHDHGACYHTHPFEEAKAALGMGFAAKQLRGSGWGSYHSSQKSTKGR